MAEKAYSAKIEIVPIDSIKPYIQNPKKHDNKQVALIAASIRRMEGLFMRRDW